MFILKAELVVDTSTELRYSNGGNVANTSLMPDSEDVIYLFIFHISEPPISLKEGLKDATNAT